MRKYLTVEILECRKCPYFRWEDDNSESNSSGSSNCKEMGKVICYDDKNPKFPNWCPLSRTPS